MALERGKIALNLPKLPPPIDYLALIENLGEAHASLARLDETLLHLRNPGLIERTFLTREALMSSQIEGTQATLEEVFKKDIKDEDSIKPEDKKWQEIQEVINYRGAMREGVKMIDAGNSLAENNIKKLHRILLQSVRGKTRAPGDFRRDQVYIAPPGTPMTEARYIPPPATQIPELYSNLDRYLNTEGSERDPLVQIAVTHYQFEAIHPFADGNGRVGRLMIPLFLYQRKILSRPYMYISKYLEEHRRDYYDLLADVTYKDAWIPWTRFFLKGISEQAKDACALARKIIDLQLEYERRLKSFDSSYAFSMLEAMFRYPIFTTATIRERAGIKNVQTGLNLISKFIEAGMLKDLTPERKRNKAYAFTRLMDLLNSYKASDGSSS